MQTECHWYCDQANFTNLPDNIFSDKDIRDDLFKPYGNEIAKDCNCKNLLDKNRPAEHFLHVPLEYNEQFDEKVNMNISIVKFATNVWQRGKYFQRILIFKIGVVLHQNISINSLIL